MNKPRYVIFTFYKPCIVTDIRDKDQLDAQFSL